MNPTTIFSQLVLPNQTLLFDLEAFYGQLQQVTDRRKRRGVRYPLAEMLMIGILATLAGQTSSRAIAEWAEQRSQELSHLFDLRRKTMPHFSTWSRILAAAVDPNEVESVMSRFFAKPAARRLTPGERHLVWMAKRMRRDASSWEQPGGPSACCLSPKGRGGARARASEHFRQRGECCASAACHGGSAGNGRERGCHFRFAQAQHEGRGHAKGDYLWMSKENQIQRYQDSEALFEPQPSRPGWSAPPMDFRSSTSIDLGHGRLERRRIAVSSLLASYAQ